MNIIDQAPRRKVFDCFLYNGELDVLCIRLQELNEVVHRFIVVESDRTFSGKPKTVTFNPLERLIAAFAQKIRHVVVTDMPSTDDPWQREAWQRNAILRGVPDADPSDLILVSDVDEIPRATIVQNMAQDMQNCIFGLRLAFYYFFVNYRNVEGPEAAITWTVGASRDQLGKTCPNDMRYAVRAGRLPARIISDAGWHFSYLTDDAGIRRKIRAFSHQEFNTKDFLSSIDVTGTVQRRGDLFNRAGFRWDLVAPTELPQWVQTHRRSLSYLFFSGNAVQRVWHRVFPGKALARKPREPLPPVIVCPYLHDWESAEIRTKFGLHESRGRKLKFFMWQDLEQVGPERAFQHCWNQFPDRDIIIIHSDMAPMPDDKSNGWYDALLEYRATLPDAGMVACNLFYPRLAPREEPVRVQCAGGTFRGDKISHLHGPITEGTDELEGGVPKVALQKTREVKWVTFAGVLIRREVIRACGEFDPRYQWAYVMDVDYSFEARLRGFRLFQAPVGLQHEENRTTRMLWERNPELLKLVNRNFELFYEKWGPFSSALRSSD